LRFEETTLVYWQASHLEETGFTFSPEVLILAQVSMVLPYPSRQMLWYYLKTGHMHFLAYLSEATVMMAWEGCDKIIILTLRNIECKL
jgi:hypothetical protein